MIHRRLGAGAYAPALRSPFAISTAPRITATKARTRATPKHTRGHRLVEHDRSRGDRQRVCQQGGKAGDGERVAALVAELEQRASERITDDQGGEEGGTRTALCCNLRGEVADREEQAAGDAIRDCACTSPAAEPERHQRDHGRDTKPHENASGRAASTPAAAPDQRHREREQPDDRKHHACELATAEPTAAHPRRQIREHADPPGRDALHEHQRRER